MRPHARKRFACLIAAPWRPWIEVRPKLGHSSRSPSHAFHRLPARFGASPRGLPHRGASECRGRRNAGRDDTFDVRAEIGTHRVTGFARLGWLHRQQDVFQGTPVLVGGGNWLYLTPGAAVQVGKGVTVQAEVKLPIYRSLANKQLDSSAIFQFGISRAF